MSKDLRQKDLATIHIHKTRLGLDDDCYRALLEGLTGKRSAAALDAGERWRVICEFRRLAGEPAAVPKESNKRSNKRPGAGQDKAALVGKVHALLADAKRPWAYADGLAAKMFGVDLVQWCDASQLWRLVAALEYDKRRREKRAAAKRAVPALQAGQAPGEA